MSGRLFTYEMQDRPAFRAILARIGIDGHAVTDEAGRPTIALDRAGMEQLRTWFADHGDAAQAEAIERALSE